MPERDPLLSHPAVTLYREVCHLWPNQVQRKHIADAVGDSPAALELYREVLTQFMAEGRPRNRADWTIERFQRAQPPVMARPQETSTFSVAAIREHLRRRRIALIELAESRGGDRLSEAMSQAAAELLEIDNELSVGAQFDIRGLEDSLVAIERPLSEAMLAVVPSTDFEAITTAAKDQLKPCRSQMEDATYQETLNRVLLKRLRELFTVPSLSLFA